MFNFSETRAGWADARRTIDPRPSGGLMIGGLAYALGYAAGSVLRYGGAA